MMKGMNIFKKVLFVLFSSIIMISFVGCGYKPTVNFVQKELSGKVYVKLNIDTKDPRNSILVKDSLNQLLVQKLNSQLVYDEKLADIIMGIKINSVSMQTLQYDDEGYTKLYRAVVTIKVDYKNISKNIRRNFTISGEYNFSIDDGTTITDTKRFEAIKYASDDALDELLSKIAIESFRTK